MMNPEKSYRRGCPREATAVAVPDQGKGAFDNRGFTLIELLLVCVILGILVTLAIPSYTLLINVAKVSVCAEDIRTLEKDIGAYQAERGTFPPDLNAIGKDTLLDPWGHGYKYYNIANGSGTQYHGHFGHDLNSGYDLYSLGKDNDTTKAITLLVADKPSQDDIVRAGDGAYVGLASAESEF